MAYFGLTVQEMIDAMSGIQSSIADFGGSDKLQAIMKRHEGDIASQMPEYMMQMLYGGTQAGYGLIKGHILTDVSKDEQTSTKFPMVAGFDSDTVEVYLNFPQTITRDPQVDDTGYILATTDYTVETTGLVTYPSKFGLGDRVLANYETTWSGGIESLKNILVALVVEELIGTNYDEETREKWENKITAARDNIKDMRNGKFIPEEIASLQLHIDNAVNESVGSIVLKKV